MDILKQYQNKLIIKHGSFNDELTEQLLCVKYLEKNDVVLEIGGNIGRVSLIISSIINSKNLVVIESDKDIFNKLLENRNVNNLSFCGINGVISNSNLYQYGWNVYTKDEMNSSNVDNSKFKLVPNISYKDIINNIPHKFNTLVIDCEGSFYNILKQEPYILNGISKIIIENDYRNIEQKQYVNSVLEQNGFDTIESINLPKQFHKYHKNSDIQKGFYEVKIRKYVLNKLSNTLIKPKIAFCFLIIDGINLIELWKQFLLNIPEDLYNVYIHCKYPDKFNDPFFFKFKIKKHVKTEWGLIEDATALLYEEAMKDPDNKYFVPLSESTIPVKSFHSMYKYLFKNKNMEKLKSYIKYWKKDYLEDFTVFKNIYKKKNINPLFIENIKYSHYYKFHSWCILNRKHANLLINETFYRECFKNHIASSENYTMYILSINNEYENIHNIQVTGEDWSNAIEVKDEKYENLGRRPRTIENITKIQAEKYFAPKFLFARKFSKNSNIVNYVKY